MPSQIPSYPPPAPPPAIPPAAPPAASHAQTARRAASASAPNALSTPQRPSSCSMPPSSALRPLARHMVNQHRRQDQPPLDRLVPVRPPRPQLQKNQKRLLNRQQQHTQKHPQHRPLP